jgi:predicted transcriptional regulator
MVRAPTRTDLVRGVLPIVYRNEMRPRILKHVMTNGKTYVSEVSRALKMNKRTVQTNFSALEDAGLVKSEWKVIRVKGKLTLVKGYTPSATLNRSEVRKFLP